MLSDDAADSNGVGTVGFLSDRMKTEAPFWRLVCTLRLSPKEVDSWTLGEMRLADAFLTMQNDYKRIWSPYYDLKKEAEAEASDEAEAILEQSKAKGKV